MNTKTYAYINKPTTPSAVEIASALLVLSQVLVLALWGAGKVAYTLGQWCGHYYYHHEEVDAKLDSQVKMVRDTLQYTLLCVVEDARAHVKQVATRLHAYIARPYDALVLKELSTEAPTPWYMTVYFDVVEFVLDALTLVS